MRQRIRAPLRLAVPARRIRKAATPERSDTTASRRVAVKSSARGFPQISPMTAERAEHLSPSSIAHSASRASRASTWIRFCIGKPEGWTRPHSTMAMRSWIHSRGLSQASCASRNPAQPASRGCVAKSSQRVGIAGFGKSNRFAAVCRPVDGARTRWSCSPCQRRDEAAARLPPPATR